jgi:isoleucyl-tRNA synthetase
VDGTPYVSMEEGTGLVHTAPGHGREDFEIGERAGLGVSCPVDEAGRFTAGTEPFVGRSVLEVNDDIVAWLQQRGRLLAGGRFTHSYPHCWRCSQPVIFRATHQWFMVIDHEGHRQRALDVIEREVRWDPPASRNRIRESVRERPDWCLSRQRSWGVGIPAIYCEACGAASLDPDVMRSAAAATLEHGSDAWYEWPIERFVRAGLRCAACGATGPFRKETDILDVWFDSGSTYGAVQVTHPELASLWARAAEGLGRVIYFEGPDQHRGWFNSSLMVGVGISGRAPYTDVMTHGWVLDAKGFAMHKSKGNVISPEDLVERSGAEIVRWWALAADWRNDVRVGDEILQRVAEAYRKVRNTFRFLLGNLADFDPELHRVPRERLTRVDRAFSDRLSARIARMRGDWEQLIFHRALDNLLDLCTVDLSAVFLDVAKGRLYTLAPDDPARRSAQTVLWQALHDVAIAASPALVFTADEVWEHHPALVAECESVHFALWPPGAADERDGSDWEFLLSVRNAVNAAIEPRRATKELSTTTEADVTILTSADPFDRLRGYEGDELDAFLLVARARVERAEQRPAAPDLAGEAASEFAVRVERTAWPKCERCWCYRPDVAAAGPRQGLCGRCASVLASTSRDAAG